MVDRVDVCVQRKVSIQWSMECGSMTHIPHDLRSMDSDLKGCYNRKKSVLYENFEFFIFLKVINLWGDFEALNDIFSQSKPMRIEVYKVHFVSTTQIK
jgi:hypothetical protein